MKIKLSNFILPVRLFINRWLGRNLCHNLNLHHNLSPFLLILFLLLSLPAHAQVVIKERVEIEPQIMHSYSPTINAHSIRFEIEWEAVEVEGHFWNADLYVKTWAEDNCGNKLGINGPSYGWPNGSQTININPVMGHSYFLWIEMSGFYNAYQYVDYQYRIFIDDELRFSSQTSPPLQIYSGSLYFWKETVKDSWGMEEEYYYKLSELNISGEVCNSSNAELSLEYTYGNCDEPTWKLYQDPEDLRLYSDPVSLQITQGSQYVSFFNKASGTDLGNTTTLSNMYEIGDIVLKADESAPFVTDVQDIIVEASIIGSPVASETKYYPPIFEIITDVYPSEITTGEESEIDINLYNECATAPDETKINLEIIKGNEAASLINPYTDERSDTVSNLDHWSGYIYANVIADGNSPNETDTVIVKVSTTDPSIAPKEVPIYIIPPPIYVYTNPAELSTSDTAEVIIKKRNPDGTLEDFPAEQTFELAVTDECVNGNILVDTTLNIYFEDAVRPIYFVTADSIEGGTGFVSLRVGTDLGGGGVSKPSRIREADEKFLIKLKRELNELREGYARIVDQRKNEMLNHMNKAGENPSPEGTIISACYIGDYLFNYAYWRGKPIIKEPIRVKWDKETKPINLDPKMPDLDIKVIPIASDIHVPYIVTWGLEVKWISKKQSPDKTFKYTFYDKVIGESREGITLEIPHDDNTIVGGDELTLTVSIGDHLLTKKLKDMKILGDNGQNNVQMVKDYINAHEFPQPIDLPLSEPVTLQDQRKQMQVLVDIESSFFQFLDTRYEFMPHGPNDIGYPNMNPNPHDWGLSQLSVAEPSLGVIWNWKTNINAGIHHLWGEKLSQLKRDGRGGGFYEIKERLHENGIEVPNLNRQEFLVWLAQRYKGGHYYKHYRPGKPEDGKKGTWVKNPKHHSYGDDFCVRFGFSKCEEI